MALTKNTALRNVLADAFASTFAGGTLQLRTAASGGGTLLASITLPNPCFGAAATGVISKSGTWSDSSCDNSGTAAFARFISSDTNKIADFTVGLSGSGADMILDNTTIVAGGVFTINTFTITDPAS